MSEYIAKASIEPRDYRVVFLIQKFPRLLLTGDRDIYFLAVFAVDRPAVCYLVTLCDLRRIV